MSKRSTQTTEQEMVDSVRRGVAGLHRIGVVDDATLRQFEDGTFVDDGISGAEVRAIRQKENATQADLAWYLGVATSTVGQWERGVRRPEGPAAKLLALVKAKGLDYIR